MYRLSLLVLFIGLLTISSLADARPKKVIPILVNPTNDVQLYFEPSSVSRIGSTIRFRLQAFFTPSHQNDFKHGTTIHKFNEPVSRLADTIEMSCSSQTYLSVKNEFYGVDDNLLWTYDYPEDQEPSAVDENSISGTMFQMLCNNRKPAPKQSI